MKRYRKQQVLAAFHRWGLDPASLAAEIPALRVGGAEDLDVRLRFLTRTSGAAVTSDEQAYT